MPNEKMTLVERLQNPEWVHAELRELVVDRTTADMAEGAERIQALTASLAEMVGIYWGAGDGDPEPPDCIKRAKALLTA